MPLLSVQGTPAKNRTLFFQCHRGLTPKQFQNCAVVTEPYKLVGYPGTFGDGQIDTSTQTPRLELYDVPSDKGERDDLAGRNPEVVARLKDAYGKWFDDVRSSRDFAPGTIVIDNSVENPVVLSRYQDGHFEAGFSQGWKVKIAKSGRFRIQIERGPIQGPAVMHVTWQDEKTSRPLEADSNAAVFDLDAGRGMLDIWLQKPGEPRKRIGNNSTAGNVRLMKIGV